MIVCANCGHENEDKHTVCHKCFRPLEAAVADKEPAAAAMPPADTPEVPHPVPDTASPGPPAADQPLPNTDTPSVPSPAPKRPLGTRNILAGLLLLALLAYLGNFFYKLSQPRTPAERALQMLPQTERGFGYLSAIYINFREFREVYHDESLPRSLHYLLQPLSKIGIRHQDIDELFFWDHKHPSAIAVVEYSQPRTAGRIRALGYGTRKRGDVSWFSKPTQVPAGYALLDGMIYYGQGVNNLLRTRDNPKESMLKGETALAAMRQHIKYDSFIIVGNESFLPLARPRPKLCLSGRLLAPDRARLHLVAEFDGVENALASLRLIKGMIAEMEDDPDALTQAEIVEEQLNGKLLTVELEVTGYLEVFSERLTSQPFD